MRARLVTVGLALLLAPGLGRAQDELQLENVGGGLQASAFFSPYDNLDQKVLAALDQARPGTTVYMSYYSLSYAEYPKMYKKLKDRGVTVRLNLYEGVALDPTYAIDDELKAQGYDVQLIPNLRSPTGTASLHTKFTVVNDELIVTGSANLSASASLANHEHVVILRSPQLARLYMAEWNEQRASGEAMRAALTPEEWETFHSSQQFPDDWDQGRGAQLQARLRELDRPTSNSGSTVRTYFSPDDVCERQAVDAINKAKKSVRIAMYSFVSMPLARATVAAARRGCEVIIVSDEHQQSIGASEPVNSLFESEPRIRHVKGANHLGNFSSIHHKYGIIDDEVILAGSFNWTVQANRYNDENLIVIRSKKLAERFLRDFNALLTAYDPAGALVPVAMPGDQSRVLLCVAYRGVIPRGWELVVFGDSPALGDGDPKRGVALRTSRSVEPNWLGSLSLPRGVDVTLRFALRKQGSLTDAINGDTGESAIKVEQGDGHPLAVNRLGVAQLHRDEWKGPQPAFETPTPTVTNGTPLNNPTPAPPGTTTTTPGN
jgi:phosphatidylserine/phosphatidylglycerophosphate/cardiolipin synthase-like enzyme